MKKSNKGFKIEVGMYVRTIDSDQYPCKIDYVDGWTEDEPWFHLESEQHNCITNAEVIAEAGWNLAEVVHIGDQVNGLEVTDIAMNYIYVNTPIIDVDNRIIRNRHALLPGDVKDIITGEMLQRKKFTLSHGKKSC
ncbi:hypothetical protein [Clostridium sp.]|uniref:hypothetical protein n=1 Tax=Clostridium sp. TaxID=1506 RepID=UPI001A5E6686|nr:hypothetical protein [Clostridium sp.]MBK5234084.1 hypothetical protein [Clostridium sp.]